MFLSFNLVKIESLQYHDPNRNNDDDLINNNALLRGRQRRINSVDTSSNPNNLFNLIQTRQIDVFASCQLNNNGFFGQPIGISYEIQYLYQTTVINGTSSTTIVNDIAPALDRQITTATIPYLFSQCSNTTRRRLLQQIITIIQSRNLQSTEPRINAISSLPQDQFILSGCKLSSQFF